MKNRWFVAVSLALIVIALASCPNDSHSYSFGDTGPAGGIIFYDKGSSSDGWRYLEAAPENQSSMMWWGTGVVTGATATAVGSGASNTTAIVGAYGAGIYAAQICDDLVLGGFSDWYLPSYDELIEMLTLVDIGRIDSSHNFWSSTESGTDYAWCCWYGGSESRGKGANSNVRAIRKF